MASGLPKFAATAQNSGTASAPPSTSALPRSVEWPTLAVALAIYLGFGALTWFHALLPWWLLLPLGGVIVAWQGSLQHEVVHGHPTPWRWFNRLLVLPSLWLWLPFEQYRKMHLTHHRDEYLTDPRLDPESFYVAPHAWERLSPPLRAGVWAMNSLLGRLLLGPLYCVGNYLATEARAILGGSFEPKVWGLHLLGCGIVLLWALGLCGMSLESYILVFAYPGTALTLLRSFLEHRARPAVAERTAIVEAGPLFSLLYLNNNLHSVHHAYPGLPWYRLPARYQAERAAFLAANGDYRFKGYVEVARRFLLRAKEAPVHPLAAGGHSQGAAALPQTAVAAPQS